MVEVRILVIDDTDMSDPIKALEAKLNKEQIILTSSFIHLNNDYYDKDDNLDLSVIERDIEQEKQQGRFDLIMVDYDYGKEQRLNGLSVVKSLRSTFPKTKIVLYSGVRKQVIEDILQSNGVISERGGINYEKMVTPINSLMGLKIEAFITRESFVSEAIKILKQRRNKDTKEFLIDKMSQHPNLVIKAPEQRSIDGKTLGEVVKNLEGPQVQVWLDEILDQLIAYLTKIYE